MNKPRKRARTTETDAENAKPARRKRSREGGYRWMKDKLYARIQYVDESGRRRDKVRQVRSGKITDVWKEVRQMRDELNHLGEETLHSDRMTLSELADKYKEAKVFPAVIRDGHKVAGLKSHKPVLTYIKIAKEHFGKKPIRSIKPRDIEHFRNVRLNTPVEIEVSVPVRRLNEQTKRMKKVLLKEKRVTPRKLASVNRELATLRRMLNYAVNEGWLLHNPFDRTENLVSNASEKAREKVLSYEEEARLLAECTGDRAHLKPVLICALDTAMRPDEIFKLLWSDVDLSEDVIRVRAENTKTETERIVGITPRLHEELQGLWASGPKRSDLSVFGVASVKNSFKTACRLANIRDFRFRDCRHTATTRMVNSGIPQAEIMKMTGHTQLKTFLRYVNLTATSARENAQNFGLFVESKLDVQSGSEIVMAACVS
jgi:integrase